MTEKYIAGIYNYCDTYCQRCRFAERCHIANEALDDTLEEVTDESVLSSTQKTMDEILEFSQEMMANIAESMGISIEELMSKIDGKDDASLIEPSSHPVYAIAMELSNMINEQIETESLQNNQAHIGTILFMIREGLLSKTMKRADYEQTRYHLESILWYFSAFSAKVERALEGLADSEEDEDPIQNDANGSAKAAMHMIEQLVEALIYIQKRHHVQLKQIIDKAEELSNHIATLFPNYAKFIRPGFDTHV
jgi:hypothetical protein